MKYVCRRLLQLIPILLGITFLSFAMMHVAGSDVVTQLYTNRGVEVSQEIIDAKRAELGLDKPFFDAVFYMAEGYAHRRYGHILCDRKKCFRHIYGKTTGHLIIDGFIHIAYGTDFYPAGDSGCHKAGKVDGSSASDKQFYRQRHAEFLRCYPADGIAQHQVGLAAGDCQRCVVPKCDYADLDTCYFYVGKIYAAGAGDCSGGIEQRLCHRT